MPFKKGGMKSKRRTKRGRKKTTVSEKVQYGIVKTINYGGFHCFKEKQIYTGKLYVEQATGNLVPAAACFGGTSSGQPGFDSENGMTHTLESNNTFNNLYNAQAASYQALFQYYKITGVKIVLLPNINVKSTTAAIGSRQIPRIWYIENSKNASFTPADIQAVITQSRAKYKMADKPLSIMITPKQGRLAVLDPQAATTQNDIYVPKEENQWLPTTAPSGTVSRPQQVEHSGFHWGMICPGWTAGNQIPFQMVVTTYYQFKGNK